jgi:hypothetical protein
VTDHSLMSPLTHEILITFNVTNSKTEFHHDVTDRLEFLSFALRSSDISVRGQNNGFVYQLTAEVCANSHVGVFKRDLIKSKLVTKQLSGLTIVERI